MSLHTSRDPPRQAETRPVRLPPGAGRPLLEEITESFETVWRERADLADRVEQLEDELMRYRELEALLRTTLVSAERAAHELKEQAKREADVDRLPRLRPRRGRSPARRAPSARRSPSRPGGIRLLLHAALDALDEADERTRQRARPSAEVRETKAA